MDHRPKESAFPDILLEMYTPGFHLEYWITFSGSTVIETGFNKFSRDTYAAQI